METILNPGKSQWESLCKRPVFEKDNLETVVKEILERVRNESDKAVAYYSGKFDGLSEGDLKINSIRFYKTKPVITNLTSNVCAVYYPFNTGVLDVMELVPNLAAWADSTSYSLGNWTSMEDVKSELKKFNIKKTDIITESNPENSFKEFDELYCIGFDVLQLPKFIIKCSN